MPHCHILPVMRPQLSRQEQRHRGFMWYCGWLRNRPVACWFISFFVVVQPSFWWCRISSIHSMTKNREVTCSRFQGDPKPFQQQTSGSHKDQICRSLDGSRLLDPHKSLSLSIYIYIYTYIYTYDYICISNTISVISYEYGQDVHTKCTITKSHFHSPC